MASVEEGRFAQVCGGRQRINRKRSKVALDLGPLFFVHVFRKACVPVEE